MSPTETGMQLIQELSCDLKPEIERIEASLPTTKNHYGEYLAILTRLGKDRTSAAIVAVALLKAGGNKQGIADALNIAYPGIFGR